ncbi:hypothetical protein MMC22_008837, partial [Lobaria immixta]|nr:hypothetical protein [Lobaria immixta]
YLVEINMSVEAWADAAHRSPYGRRFEHERAIDTFLSVLQGNTPPNAAASTISSLYEPVIKARSGNVSVGTLWAIFCGTSFRRQQGARRASSRPAQLGLTAAGLYWRGLPELTMIFREDAMDFQDEDEMEGDCGENQALPLLNATTFGAIYLNRGKQPVGMTCHAEASFMSGVETPYQTPDQQREAEIYVPPAATWILLAGEKIHELCKGDYNRHEPARPSGAMASWLWCGDRGYSLGRWEYWKQRFGEIAMTQGLQDGVKDLARRALSKMDMIESQMK